MNRPANALALTALALACTLNPGMAATTHFRIKPIIIPGASEVHATAINKHGAITGYYVDPPTYFYSFVLDHGKLTSLESDCHGTRAPCNPFADAISDSGAVAGHYSAGTATYSFLWQNGTYNLAGNIWMGNNYSLQWNPIGINQKGMEFYNLEPGGNRYGYIPYAGFPGEYAEILPNGGFNAYASSISNDGTVAGETLDDNDLEVAFIARKGNYKYFPGPYGNGVISPIWGGIYINDNHQLAGLSESTQTYATTGWVYTHAAYATFDFPFPNHGKVVQSATLQGINNSGRVVGFYTDPNDNMQHAFLYNGSTVSVFGNYTPYDVLRMGISDDGTILLSYDISSYRVTCRGTGC
jgi:probable HAF family extracellular repeat protein